MKNTKQDRSIIEGFYLVYLSIGLIWLQSVYGKIVGGKFVATLDIVLKKFASENPYLPVKTFLENIAIPNAETFAALTITGELFAAVSLIITSGAILTNTKHSEPAKYILLLGMLTGALLNIIFFLSAGWTSPSTWSINALMAALQIIGAVTMAKNIKYNRSRSV